MSKKELTAVQETMPDFLKNSTSTRGTENVGTEDLVIPRLELVQSLSPARKKSDAAYIEGADEGMLFNNVTRQLYNDHVMVVPVTYKKEWLIWKNRDAGGGFRGAFDSESAARRAMDELEDGAQCEVVDTAQHFCLLVHPDGRAEDIVVSCSKSKMKVSRRWNSLIRLNEGDSFSRVYKLGAVAEQGDKGDYYNFTVSAAGYPSEALYRRAESLYTAITAGFVKVDRAVDAAPVSDEY
jgi:hypothetical protein